MSQQMSFMEDLTPEPKLPLVTHRLDLPRREVQTRAYGRNYTLTVYEGCPDPIEIEVRGIPCLIEFSSGFSTYALQKPGSQFWSETGYRNFQRPTHDPEEIAALITAFIDAPAKDGCGCGGKLSRWWPPYVNSWRQNLSFGIRNDRATTWDQWGPDKHAELWAEHDAKLDADMARMRREGIDPNDVGPPAHHSGAWPIFPSSNPKH